ncbi:MAG: hypothetical protein KME07_03085 [Pegethrix bostrychoides GSE-TBD4-15B]|jgi:hypothetical protein|uniref:Uncharacterized protein n=1 Tax=Pegethrix bostrychoides GSE-TBD4-15B TaxID=2839662 RepID=A0A951P8B4_9CYAN|nr:hypothetical protein [Pegethrix bostrychoides GSE-TBD4-15B]
MSTEFNERLPEPLGHQAQIWIVGTREQVNHVISEMYVRQMITDRSQFSPMVPAPFSPGKYMSVLLR